MRCIHADKLRAHVAGDGGGQAVPYKETVPSVPNSALPTGLHVRCKGTAPVQAS